MKKKLIIVFSMLFFSMVNYGQFSSKEIIDKMTDEITVSFASFSDKQSSFGNRVGIYLNATKEYVFITIDFGGMNYLADNHILEYRFDKEPMGKLNCRGSETASFPFFVSAKTNDKDFQIFLDNLLNHETLIVRTKTITSNTLDETFNITGLKSEITKRNIKGTVLEEYIK